MDNRVISLAKNNSLDRLEQYILPPSILNNIRITAVASSVVGGDFCAREASNNLIRSR